MRRVWPLVSCGLMLAWHSFDQIVEAQQATVSDATRDDEARDRSVIERFVTVLEKNPRRGTALEKVYAFHLERGSLESWLQSYRDRLQKLDTRNDPSVPATANTSAASLWMVVGLVESMRGRDATALEAFRNAEQLDSGNALAAYYLGQSFVHLGQTDKAVEAFERAIARQPARADLLEIFQALGRLHQRTARADKALEAWNRLEQQFPNDAQVQEQIATALPEEEAFDAALPRFEKLAQGAKDRSKQLAFRMEAADIRVRLGQTDDALKEFEQILGQLNPDHWIYRDVRRRIEDIFLRGDNRAGLATYYEVWLAKHPDDLDAIARLARVYSMIGRDATAIDWLERAVKLAPSRRDLRRALIDRLLQVDKFPEAIAHFEQLHRAEPNNPDTLRDWGRALLKDPQLEMPERRQAAAAIWKKLADARPNDAITASQVGDLMRQAELTDEAIAQYRRAIELAPEATQYREYLGEYFHSMKKPEHALGIWREIASGNRRTATNLARLAEVLAAFGYVAEAIENNAEACRLDPKDFALQLKQVDLLSRAERHDDAISQLAKVESLIANEDEREAWLSRDLRIWQALGKLKERISEVAKAGDGEPATTDDRRRAADRWYWLARAYESERQLAEALQAVRKAGDLAPQSIPIQRTLARILEAQRNLIEAAQVFARLVTLDRRYRAEYLQQLASLERQLGHREQALQAGRDLIAAAPDNPEFADFFAQLCFQLNAVDEGLDALRRSARANSTDPSVLVRLATALIDRQRGGEAIELLWRAFDKSPKLEDRLSIISKLIEAHATSKQQSRVIERLAKLRGDKSQRRAITLCLAHAFLTMGQDTAAQKELESLLSEEARDPSVLKQLRHLAEKRQEWVTAANYQRQVWQITQDKRDRYELAQLLLKSDNSEAAMELLTTESGQRELTDDVIQLLDGLYVTRKLNEVRGRLKSLRQRFPDSWELLYREGVVLAEDDPQRATDFFKKIIAMNRPEDELSLERAAATAGRSPLARSLRLPLINRLNLVGQMKTAISRGVISTYATVTLPQGGMQRVVQTRLVAWAPDDYGEVRLAAWGWLVEIAKRHNEEQDLRFRLDGLVRIEPPTRQSLMDVIAISTFLPDHQRRLQAARRLARLADAEVDQKALYLQFIAERHLATSKIVNGRVESVAAKPAPLDDAAMNDALATYREIAHEPAVAQFSVAFLATLLTELKLAQRDRDADELLATTETDAVTDAELSDLIDLAALNLRTTSVLRLLDRLITLRERDGTPPPSSTPRSPIQIPTIVSGTNGVVAGSSTTIATSTVRWSMNNRQALTVLAHHLVRDQRREDLLAIWNRHVRLKCLALSSPNTVTAPQTSSRVTPIASLDSGNRSIQILGMSDVFDFNDGRLLAEISVGHHDVPSNKPAQGLLEMFRDKAAGTDIPVTERLVWSFAYAHLLWWNGRQDEALEVLNKAVERVPERIDLRRNLALLYESRGQPSVALRLVDDIVSDSPDVRYECEQQALRLALQTDRRDRARTAAERLFGMTIPQPELLPLAELMLKIDMADQAEALLLRAASNSQRDVRAVRLLMDIQLNRDQLDAAGQTARTLIDSIESRAVQTASTMVQYPTTYSGRTGMLVTPSTRSLTPNELEAYRNAAFEVLIKSGKLKELIDEVEAKLKASPSSVALIARLIAYHTAARNQTRIDELILMRHELELTQPVNRFAVAVKCLELNRTEEAIGHVRVLIEKEPAYFASRSTDMVFRFAERKQLDALTVLFDGIDWSRYDQYPQMLPKVVELLLAKPETHEHGTKLFLKQWQSRPQKRVEMLHRFQNDDLWKLPDVAATMRQIPIPTDAADVANQWSIFGRVLRYESNGTTVVTVLNRILSVIAARNELDLFAGDLEKRMTEWPKWTAGKVLLALVDLRRGRIEAGRDALEKLHPELSKQFANSPSHAWEIAQELTSHKEGLDVGVRYYETAMSDRGVDVWASNSSPARAIIQSFSTHGRQRDARRLLLKAVPTAARYSTDETTVPTSAELNAVQWIGRELRGIGFSIDAIHAYQAGLHRSERMTIGGYDPRVELQSSLAVAFGELVQKPAALTEYLSLAENTPPLFDLQLFVSDPKSPQIKLRSRWTSIIDAIVSDAEEAQSFKAILSRTRTTFPDDLPLMILHAQLALATKDAAETKSLVTQLASHIQQHPLPKPIDKQPASPEQQRTAQTHVALWLIARECLNDPALKEDASKLATAAQSAASQHTNADISLAITEELKRANKQAADVQP